MAFRPFAIPLALFVLASGAAAEPTGLVAELAGQTPSIGIATMLPDGTIVLDLRAEGPGGMIGDARLTYRPGEPHYPAVRDHLPGLRPGMTVMVPPFD
ncbi:hypothetical protein [Roseomonas haemaphysalidis]|uniref:Uncharacterized protein n=1 Tax=Roseomonas haemaphysalidis TaxID=2768162 RepID=A0ABS3KVV7_9PROT|nr:hypothetical protein [Roseomonas haemaphysalidis]MBO1081616.1 hypothetical protein [Roseomonas haemaphysalidis]